MVFLIILIRYHLYGFDPSAVGLTRQANKCYHAGIKNSSGTTLNTVGTEIAGSELLDSSVASSISVLTKQQFDYMNNNVPELLKGNKNR